MSSSHTVDNEEPMPACIPLSRDTIGSGGQAKLYLVNLVPCGKLVVMKVFKKKDHRIVYLENYHEVMTQIRSVVDREVGQHLVTIIRGPTSAIPRAILEFCNGGDLFDLIHRHHDKKEMIPESFIWHVFSSLITAVDFLHTGYGRSRRDPSLHPAPIADRCRRRWKTILHRDLKPENVLFTQNPDDHTAFPIVKLTDFDLACLDNPGKTFLCGSPWYHPPEQRRYGPTSVATPGGDVWAVGAIVHEMAVGRAPGDHSLEAIAAGQTRDADTWEEASARKKNVNSVTPPYSPELQKCVDLALCENAAERANSSILRETVKAATQKYNELVCSREASEGPLLIRYRIPKLTPWKEDEIQEILDEDVDTDGEDDERR